MEYQIIIKTDLADAGRFYDNIINYTSKDEEIRHKNHAIDHHWARHGDEVGLLQPHWRYLQHLEG